MLFIWSIAVIYLEENFAPSSSITWKNLPDDPIIAQCFASHPTLVRRCVSVDNSTSFAELTTSLKSKISSFPLFLSFTARGELPSSGSLASVSLKSGETTVYSAGYSFSESLQYQFNISSTPTVASLLDHERYLTHYLALLLQSPSNYTLYADGYIVATGSLPASASSLSIDSVTISLAAGNSSVEIGNLHLSNEPSMRWKTLISSLLRLRSVERSKVTKVMVDEMERRLFHPIIREKLDPDEDGVIFTEEQCDPRRFSFPFKLNSTTKSEYLSSVEEAAAMYASDEEIRHVEQDEVGEDEEGGDEDAESDL
jgi:hypothetical protein